MRLFSIFLFVLLFACLKSIQDRPYEKFANSFKEEGTKEAVNFGLVVLRNSSPMTKQEALQFVYNGDTTRLFCNQKIFSMETEKVSEILTELYLPNKCLKISTGNYTLLGYSEYTCQNPDDLVEVVLNLAVVNKNFQVTDRIEAYRGTDYDFSKTGLISPAKLHILLLSVNQDGNKMAGVYRVNPETLEFEIIREKKEVQGSVDNLVKIIEENGWNTFF